MLARHRQARAVRSTLGDSYVTSTHAGAQADSHLELYLSPVVLTAAIDDFELFERLAGTTVCRAYGGWVRVETEKYGCDCDGCACGGTSTSITLTVIRWNNGEYILTIEDGDGWRSLPGASGGFVWRFVV